MTKTDKANIRAQALHLALDNKSSPSEPPEHSVQRAEVFRRYLETGTATAKKEAR